MTKYWGVAVLLASCLLPLAAQAGGQEQFKQFLASTKAARGEFSQELIKNVGEQKVKGKPASGSFAFARPGKFIWTYQKPYEQVLQADGEKLYIHDKDLNQVTVKKLGNALAASPAAILFGSNEVEKNFTMKDAPAKDGMEWLELIPKQNETSFRSISLGLRAGLPQEMLLMDTFGQISHIKFTRFEKNPNMPADMFKFTMPTGVDVFQQ